MSRLDPRLLLQGYATGIFPMADSRARRDIRCLRIRGAARQGGSACKRHDQNGFLHHLSPVC